MVFEELKNEMKKILSHVNTKRIQAAEFNQDKADPLKQVLQIDYAMAYTCEYQDEVQSALWGRGSVNLFTVALSHNGNTKTFLFCTNYKNKDKFSNRVFLEYLYKHEIPTDETVSQEIIWSDGPTSEFKNQYTRKLLQTLSGKYNKEFVWKFSAMSHGKGVVDGVGGNVKSTVRRKCMSKRKDRIVVEDSLSFAKAATRLGPSTKIIHVTSDEILKYQNTQPFKESKAVVGIASMHIMSVHYDATKLWHNAVEYNNENPSIDQNSISTSALQQNLNEFNVPSEDDKCLKELPFDSG